MLTESSFASTSEVQTDHFGLVEATGLKTWRQGHQWHDLHTKFTAIYQLVQRLLVGDTQTQGQAA
jgi:hypothetical protein